MMKIVILNDCSARDEASIHLLKGICDGISLCHEFEWVNIRGLSAKSCKNCFKCQPFGECILPEDDAHRVGRMLFSAGALVLGLSSSLEEISISLSNLLDRLKGFLTFQNPQGDCRPWFEGRPAAIVCRQSPEPATLRASSKRPEGHAVLPRILESCGFRLVETLPASMVAPMVPIEMSRIDQARAVGRGLSLSL